MARCFTAVLALVLGLCATPAMAAKVALVIGNANYEHTAALQNPSNDAKAFAAFLRTAGYDVTETIDADRSAMSAALSQFAKKLTSEDTALFYYAGHGMQMAGENYLVGVEAQLLSEFDVPSEAISLASVIEAMESRAKVAILFIDACRNNPLADNLAPEATRSISRGLAPVEAKGDGTMIAFAASPGRIAYDGNGENSPFTDALVHHLATRGLEVGAAFRRVVADVRAATGGRQTPQIVSSLSIEIYFGAEVDIAAQDYEKAERLGTLGGWQVFLEKYPEGFYADLARAAVDELQREAPLPSKISVNHEDGVVALVDFPFNGTIVDIEVFFAFTTDCERDHLATITSPEGFRVPLMEGVARCEPGTYSSRNHTQGLVSFYRGAEAGGAWRFSMRDLVPNEHAGTLIDVILKLTVDNEGIVTSHTVSADGLPAEIPNPS